jgi:hypothetical protein
MSARIVCRRILLAGALALALSPAASAAVTAVNIPSTLNANTWANGEWRIRAIHVDAANQPVGPLSSETVRTLNNEAPNADPVVPADLPVGDQIWFYRKLGASISPGESLEVFKFVCPPASPSVCEQANTGTVFLSNALFAPAETVLPVELQSFEVD